MFSLFQDSGLFDTCENSAIEVSVHRVIKPNPARDALPPFQYRTRSSIGAAIPAAAPKQKTERGKK